jgi:hypothetical protein
MPASYAGLMPRGRGGGRGNVGAALLTSEASRRSLDRVTTVERTDFDQGSHQRTPEARPEIDLRTARAVQPIGQMFDAREGWLTAPFDGAWRYEGSRNGLTNTDEC